MHVDINFIHDEGLEKTARVVIDHLRTNVDVLPFETRGNPLDGFIHMVAIGEDHVATIGSDKHGVVLGLMEIVEGKRENVFRTFGRSAPEYNDPTKPAIVLGPEEERRVEAIAAMLDDRAMNRGRVLTPISTEEALSALRPRTQEAKMAHADGR